MTQEIPETDKDEYGFPEIGYDHPTTQPDTTEKALVITHPFERFTADEEEIVEFLEGGHDYDDVYYIGQSQGRIPVHVDIADGYNHTNLQSRLPPGFEDGYYTRGLQETEWGSITEEEAEKLLTNYDEISVAGAVREDCVTNTLNSLEEVRNQSEEYAATELFLEEDITYSAVGEQ